MWDIAEPEQILLGWSMQEDRFHDLAILPRWSPFLAACLIHDCVPRAGWVLGTPGPNVFKVYRGDRDDAGDYLPRSGFSVIAASISSVAALVADSELFTEKSVNSRVIVKFAIKRALLDASSGLAKSVLGVKVGPSLRKDGLPKRTGQKASEKRAEILRVVNIVLGRLHLETCSNFDENSASNFSDRYSRCSANCQFEIKGTVLAREVEDFRTAGATKLPDDYGFTQETVLSVIRRQMNASRKLGSKYSVSTD